MKPLRRLVMIALLLVGLGGSGCATTQDASTGQSTGNYWPLDSLAMSYADPVAVSPVHDHPLRWLVFAFHPVGVILDYAVNRPIYAVASAFPSFFGYTAEDAGHQAQRSAQSYQ
jgi:hypothetical protein